MSFFFECPFCNRRLECDESLENRIVACPSCKSEIVPQKNPLENKIKIAPEPAARNVPDHRNKPARPDTTIPAPASEKKDLLFFWIVYPIFYFIYILLWIKVKNYTWTEIALLALVGLFLLFISEAAVMVETGIKDKKALAAIGLLLYILFPIGFISYAETRKERGLSNITPWAVTTSIAVGLTLFLVIGMAFS